MCQITSVCCPKCDGIDEAAISICPAILARLDAASTTFQNYGNGTPMLVHCPTLIWPPVRPVPMASQICDECTFRLRPNDNVEPHWAPRVMIKGFNEDGEIEEWSDRSEPHASWPARLSEVAHRQLTLRIPCCKLCGIPRFFFKKVPQYPNEENVRYGIEGIDLEFSSILWKWICSIRRKQFITVRLVTGFSIKPCRSCIDLETVLRGTVFKYLEKCNTSEAWGVWHWLAQRAIPEVEYWQNDTGTTEFTAAQPPDRKRFHSIMSAGWKARTGVDFSDAILSISDSADHYEFPFVKHKEPFTNLAQWNELAGIANKPIPSIVCPHPPIDLDTYQIEFDAPDSSIQNEANGDQLQEEAPSHGEKRKADDEPLTPKSAEKQLRVRFADEV
ncbi:hypothetical protein M434DRAFT_323907 [Hypoxylon sp. CO27-5]|nr:hypothetical protein M434DRAFT_323907 [Hypoxylon sp. CO27-5]